MMTVKMRRLNDTDFARNAPLPEHMQRRAFAKMTGSYAPYTLGPVRRQFPDIFNVGFPLLARLKHVHADISDILSAVRKASRSDRERMENEAVALGLHAFARGSVVSSGIVRQTAINLGESRSLWQPYYLVVNSQPILFQVDPRGSVGLTPAARRLIFSAMHSGVREVDFDYAAARLLIIQTPREGEKRVLKLHWGDDVQLHSYVELQAMAEVTERLWIEAQLEHARRRRGDDGGATGTLL